MPKNQTQRAWKKVPDALVVVGILVFVALLFIVVTKPEKEPQPTAGALMDVEDALGGLPTEYNELVKLGDEAMDSANFVLSAEAYRRALELDSSSINVRVDYGASLHGMGLPQRALEEFRKTLLIAPQHIVLNYNLGIVFSSLAQPDSANFYWNRTVQLAPNSAIGQAARERLAGKG